MTPISVGRRRRVLIGVRDSGYVALTPDEVGELIAGLQVCLERLDGGG